MSAPALPVEVETLLAWWRPRVAEVLGDALVGAWLFGSVPLGGFEKLWSDVDVCTVLAEPVTDAQIDALKRLHDEMESHFLSGDASWSGTQLFEGPYLSAALASEPGGTERCLLVGTGQRDVEPCDPVPGFERLMLAEHAWPVLGDPPPFAPDTRAAIARHHAWLPRALAEPAEAHSAIMLAGTLQETARSIVFFRDGTFLSKNDALEREIDAGGPFAPAYATALGVRRLGSAQADAFRAELVEDWETIAEPARRVVTDLLMRAS